MSVTTNSFQNENATKYIETIPQVEVEVFSNLT